MAGGPLDRSETWSDDERRAAQWRRLARALPELLLTNVFYGRKVADAGIPDVRELRSVRDLPFTTKAELSRDQTEHPPFGSNLTYPIDRYVRLHQTSGTTGRPLRVLDTAESWQWWRDCWRPIYTAAGLTSRDRIFFAFSFGPFVGFWSAFAGAEQLGALCLTGGAMSSVERVAAIIATEATVLMCTPTYALRLGEAARAEGIDIARSALRGAGRAGEPGAWIPATRERIEAELGLTSFDDTGATEVGAHGFSCDARDGVHLNESEFIAEIVDPATGETADEGDGELVMTNLGRWGMPVIRYRTGDRVRGVRGRCACGRTSLKLVCGIAGRVDDKVTAQRGGPKDGRDDPGALQGARDDAVDPGARPSAVAPHGQPSGARARDGDAHPAQPAETHDRPSRRGEPRRAVRARRAHPRPSAGVRGRRWSDRGARRYDRARHEHQCLRAGDRRVQRRRAHARA